MTVRQFDFVVGPETDTQPTVSTPTSVSDVLTVGANRSQTGSQASPTAVVAGTGIVLTNDAADERLYVEGSGGAVDVTANPQVAVPTFPGVVIVTIHGTSDVNTVKLQDGTGLSLNGDFIMGAGHSLSLEYNSTDAIWRETSRVG